ncbi:hypothetical protein DND90_21360 [Pseudomonas syringae pv. maculicola]|nr:hypothetical protein DND90_21360 [Pseudomonas syringae pv. maculicola]
MSNEFKLVPPAPCNHLGALTGQGNCMVCGAQPPALGGELEEDFSDRISFLGTIDRCDVACGSYGDKFHRWDDAGPYVEYEDHVKHVDLYKEEIERLSARLAPLQVELTRMSAQFDELAAAVGFTKDRCEQAGDSPLDCANQLQAEIERLKDNVREVTTYRDNAIKKIERLRNELTGTEKERYQLKALLVLANAALEGRIDAVLSKPAGSEPDLDSPVEPPEATGDCHDDDLGEGETERASEGR